MRASYLFKSYFHSVVFMQIDGTYYRRNANLSRSWLEGNFYGDIVDKSHILFIYVSGFYCITFTNKIKTYFIKQFTQ